MGELGKEDQAKIAGEQQGQQVDEEFKALSVYICTKVKNKIKRLLKQTRTLRSADFRGRGGGRGGGRKEEEAEEEEEEE